MAYSKGQQLTLSIDTEELTPQQIRLIKSINAMLTHVITTDDEDEFFKGSADFMRMCAAMIKQSHFADQLKGIDNIPYAEQALEYSMDILQEQIHANKVVSYDN